MMGFDITFKCPDCGGSSFGSSYERGVDSPPTRYCHGDDARNGRAGCRFSWPERHDWKYFSVNGKKMESFGELEAIMKQIRSTPAYGVPYTPPDPWGRP